MLNSLKKFVFTAYAKYFEESPIKKGKYRMGQLLNTVGGLAIYKIDGINYELNPFSSIDRKLILNREHDSIVKELIKINLTQGGVFLDIGTNFGYFSLFAAKMSNVKVLSFEPSLRELMRLYHNIYLNQFNNITVFPYGLANERKILPVYISGNLNHGRNSVLLAPDITPATKVDCQFFPLDDLVSPSILQNVKVCKIDVEGFELSVLEGMKESLKFMNNTKFVVEISSELYAQAGHKVEDIYSFFNDFGYRPRLGMRQKKQYDEIFEKMN